MVLNTCDCQAVSCIQPYAFFYVNLQGMCAAGSAVQGGGHWLKCLCWGCPAQESRQLVEHWRKEAEHQRQAAASVRAADTQRHIKQLQDSKLEADALLLQRDTLILEVGSADVAAHGAHCQPKEKHKRQCRSLNDICQSVYRTKQCVLVALLA
jgi:hypothetical protein